MDFLSGLQSKSSQVKTTYAFVFSGVITGIIALVWVSTIPARFSDVPQKEETHRGMLSVLSGKVTSQLASLKGSLPDTQTQEIQVPSVQEISTQQEMFVETPDAEAEYATSSALSTLTVSEAVSGTTTIREQEVLPKPTPEIMPQASHEAPRDVETQLSVTPEEVVPQSEASKPVLIEVKPVSQRTILIGTSTVQKTE